MLRNRLQHLGVLSRLRLQTDAEFTGVTCYLFVLFSCDGKESALLDATGSSFVVCLISHFTEEKAVGASNSLLMFCTIGPSFSLSVLIAIHSGSARNAAHRSSRSAMLSQASR
jgi:hypothetical protein